MAEPIEKDPGFEKAFDAVFNVGTTRRGDIEADRCRPAPIGCGKQIDQTTEWRSELERVEYTISGLCQTCQDRAFAMTDEEED